MPANSENKVFINIRWTILNPLIPGYIKKGKETKSFLF